MKHVATLTLGFLAVAVLFGGPPARAQESAAERDARNVVTIVLTPRAILDDTVIYLDQIAKLSGGPAALRQRMARFDVAEFKLGAEHTAVSCDQVRFRLLLAGIAPTQFQIEGAKKTTVAENDDPIAVRRILAVADTAIRFKNPSVGAPKNIIVPLLDLRASDEVRLEAKASAPTPRTGGGHVDVAIIVNGKTREVVPVAFENARTYSAVRTDAFDRELRGTLMSSSKEKTEVLIKSRDLVRIIALVGNAQIVATGEAQQDGKLGEIIRVRNTESNRVVNGRIESRDVVTVEY